MSRRDKGTLIPDEVMGVACNMLLYKAKHPKTAREAMDDQLGMWRDADALIDEARMALMDLHNSYATNANACYK